MDKGNKINAIIVDDEKGCIANLQHHLVKLCSEINIVAVGCSLQEALDKTGTVKIDVAFLDVEFFNDNIFNSLSKIKEINFKIVFVTAYQQYALKALKVEAIDYLLKPLCEDEIRECYARIKKHFFYSNHDLTEKKLIEKTNSKVIIKNSSSLYIIKYDDIYYITGSGFYSEITFMFQGAIKSVILSKPLNLVEEEYASPFLYRVHKSYIINIHKISDIFKGDGFSVKMINEKIIYVAKRRAHDFLSFINTTNE
jgi:two-component system LytT family response regulator